LLARKLLPIDAEEFGHREQQCRQRSIADRDPILTPTGEVLKWLRFPPRCYLKNRYLIIAAIAKHSTAATTTQPRTVNHSIASGTAMLRQHTQRQRPLLRPYWLAALHFDLDQP
jgi:hypothetical protein